MIVKSVITCKLWTGSRKGLSVLYVCLKRSINRDNGYRQEGHTQRVKGISANGA